MNAINEDVNGLDGLNLFEFLRNTLPVVLADTSPEQPMLADKIVSIVRNNYPNQAHQWVDASIKSTISRIAGLEDSGISKRHGGHGYYFNGNLPQQEIDDPDEIPPIDDHAENDQIVQQRRTNEEREEKFRSIFIRNCLIEDDPNEKSFPHHIEHRRAARAQQGMNA